MLDSKIKELVEEICNEITSNQTDEMIVDIVDEIYLLKGFRDKERKNSANALMDEIKFLKNQLDQSNDTIDFLKDEIDKLEELLKDE